VEILDVWGSPIIMQLSNQIAEDCEAKVNLKPLPSTLLLTFTLHQRPSPFLNLIKSSTISPYPPHENTICRPSRNNYRLSKGPDYKDKETAIILAGKRGIVPETPTKERRERQPPS